MDNSTYVDIRSKGVNHGRHEHMALVSCSHRTEGVRWTHGSLLILSGCSDRMGSHLALRPMLPSESTPSWRSGGRRTFPRVAPTRQYPHDLTNVAADTPFRMRPRRNARVCS